MLVSILTNYEAVLGMELATERSFRQEQQSPLATCRDHRGVLARKVVAYSNIRSKVELICSETWSRRYVFCTSGKRI